MVTTHDDDVNVFITLYCRRLRPEIEIVSRANLDRNVSTLYRAGADTVLSYASAGATAIWNDSGAEPTVLVSDGISAVCIPIPSSAVGRTLAHLGPRTRTGITVIGILRGGQVNADPDAALPLQRSDQLLILGDEAAHLRFREIYGR